MSSPSPHKRVRLAPSASDGGGFAASEFEDDALPSAAAARDASPGERSPVHGEGAALAVEHAPAADGAEGVSADDAAPHSSSDASDSEAEVELPPGVTSWAWNATTGNADDAARIAAVRVDYARRMAAKVAPGVAKADMQVCKEMRQAGGVPRVWGHVPGVPLGARFAGRGELSACGVHTQISVGIDWRKHQPATCVVASGGYGDDEDNGDVIQYTGQGGRCEKTKRQISDQRLERGNAALTLNHALRCPVRVARGGLDPDGKPMYTYDGLFEVVKYGKRKADTGSSRVYIFELRRLASHSRAAETRVTFRAMHCTSVLFRNAAAKAPRVARQAERSGNPPDSAQARAARLQVLRRRPGLLVEDLSGGAERVAIPLFFDAGAPGDAVAPPAALPPGFRYVRDCTAAVSAAASAVAAAAAPVVAGEKDAAGDRVVPASEAYIDGPFLQGTEPGGIVEGDAGDDAPRCVVTAGVSLPLEVFRCADARKGWGVRCAVPILEGEFIAEYAGAAHSATELEPGHQPGEGDGDGNGNAAAAGDDGDGAEIDASQSYIFSLNHFNRHAPNDAVICVDAYRTGNVARFINHAAEAGANVVLQSVFTRAGGADRRAFYRTAMFANCYIPAFTELSYNYGPAYPTHWEADGAVTAATVAAAAMTAQAEQSHLAAVRAVQEEQDAAAAQ